MRITTRLAHSRAGVIPVENAKDENKLSIPEDPRQFVLLPALAREKDTSFCSIIRQNLNRLPKIRHLTVLLKGKIKVWELFVVE
jgi:hypothetical protein